MTWSSLLFGLKLDLFLSFELVVPNKQKRTWVTKVSLQLWAVNRFRNRVPFPWNCFLWELFNLKKSTKYMMKHVFYMDIVMLCIYMTFWCLQSTFPSTALTFLTTQWGRHEYTPCPYQEADSLSQVACPKIHS